MACNKTAQPGHRLVYGRRLHPWAREPHHDSVTHSAVFCGGLLLQPRNLDESEDVLTYYICALFFSLYIILLSLFYSSYLHATSQPYVNWRENKNEEKKRKNKTNNYLWRREEDVWHYMLNTPPWKVFLDVWIPPPMYCIQYTVFSVILWASAGEEK